MAQAWRMRTVELAPDFGAAVEAKQRLAWAKASWGSAGLDRAKAGPIVLRVAQRLAAERAGNVVVAREHAQWWFPATGHRSAASDSLTAPAETDTTVRSTLRIGRAYAYAYVARADAHVCSTRREEFLRVENLHGYA